MKIAQVAPLYERVPPRLYGGTERVVSYLTEELVRQGHEVTLFASGDSLTSARLHGCSRNALRLDKSCIDPYPHHLLMLERVFRSADQFDIIHFHTDYLHYPLSRRYGPAHLTTLHGRLDIPDLIPLYREYREIPVVSISDSQRKPLPWINWQATIHHGLPGDLLPFCPKGEEYLAFVGRISPEKGVERAVSIARRSKTVLKVAAKVDPHDRSYYESVTQLLQDPYVEFVGEIDEEQKKTFLGKAKALLFPIQWEEPFGLVLIEAMSCGTPVVAFARGSVSEVVKDGVSGFVVHSEDEAVEAVGKVSSLSRERCRAHFEEHFSAKRMASEYLRVYRRLAAGKRMNPILPQFSEGAPVR